MKRKGPRRDAQKERFWQEAVRRQRRGGQSVRDFCRTNALSEPSFYAWRRELRRRRNRPAGPSGRRAAARPGRRRGRDTPGPATFVPVRVAMATPPLAEMAAVELALPSGAVLRWPAGVGAAAVAAVVSAWERSRC